MTEQTTEITAYERSVALVKAELTQYKPKQIDTVLGLLQDGNTVPFIARYRKDQTGSLDEVQIREIEERHRYLVNFEKRKDEVIRLIDEQEKLTDEILSDLMNAKTLTALEDIYRPFKQKKRTKATIAKEAGLEPLAEFLLACTSEEVEAKAATFINELTNSPDRLVKTAGYSIRVPKHFKRKLREILRDEGVHIDSMYPPLRETVRLFEHVVDESFKQ